MDKDACIARIGEARAVIVGLLRDCDLPQIEAMLRNADMELHWALWNLGAAVPLRPEADYAAEPSQGDHEPQTAKQAVNR